MKKKPQWLFVTQDNCLAFYCLASHCFVHHKTSLLMRNSYPLDRIFNVHLTSFKHSIFLAYQTVLRDFHWYWQILLTHPYATKGQIKIKSNMCTTSFPLKFLENDVTLSLMSFFAKLFDVHAIHKNWTENFFAANLDILTCIIEYYSSLYKAVKGTTCKKKNL